MKVLYHPKFAGDIRRFTLQYRAIAPHLADRFAVEVDAAIAAIELSPMGAGHFVHTGSRIVKGARRRNLRVFPFFILYAVADDQLIFGSVLPSAADPLTWLARFK